MRKTSIFVIGLVLLLISLSVVAGCQSKKQEASKTPAPEQKGTTANEPQKAPAAKSKLGDIYFVGATQGGGGVWDMMGTGLGKIISEKVSGSRVTFVPGEGVANVSTLHKGTNGDIGFVASAIAAAGAKGQEPYKEVLDKVRGIASLYFGAKHFLVLDSYPIQSIEELAQKKPKIRIAVGDPGSIIELTSRRVLAEAGVTFKDIESWGGKVQYKSMGDAADMMTDGLLDAILISGTMPIGAVQEIAASKKLKIIPFPDQIIKSMIDKYGYAPATIPKGTYPFATQDVPTFAHRTVVAANAGMSDDDIYQITKALGDNIGDIRNIHAMLKTLTPDFMASGTGVPLHPGAAKYYKEKGVIK